MFANASPHDACRILYPNFTRHGIPILKNNAYSGVNNCLFDAISEQLPPNKSVSGEKLRGLLIDRLKRDPLQIARDAEKIERKKYLLGSAEKMRGIHLQDIRFLQAYYTLYFKAAQQAYVTCLKEGEAYAGKLYKEGRFNDAFNELDEFINDATARRLVQESVLKVQADVNNLPLADSDYVLL